MIKLLLVACAGGLGTLTRYGLAGLVQRFTGSVFPWGTLVVNIIGCFLFGIVWSFFESRLQGASEYRLLILTGFMGAFTTFSTFIFETGQLIRNNEWLLVLGNIGIQNIVGLFVLFLGLMLGRLI